MVKLSDFTVLRKIRVDRLGRIEVVVRLRHGDLVSRPETATGLSVAEATQKAINKIIETRP